MTAPTVPEEGEKALGLLPATPSVPGETEAPVRVKLSRAKGWRMPPNTVSVARPGRWGNPFNLSDSAHCWTALAVGFKGDKAGRRAASVEIFRRWLAAGKPGGVCGGLGAKVGDDGEVRPIVQSPEITAPAPPTVAEIREHLAGKNLACWCPLDGEPCHADVLLELANAPTTTAAETGAVGTQSQSDGVAP